MTRLDGAGELAAEPELACEQTLERCERGFWRSDSRLDVQLGHCAIHVLVAGEPGRALEG